MPSYLSTTLKPSSIGGTPRGSAADTALKPTGSLDDSAARSVAFATQDSKFTASASLTPRLTPQAAAPGTSGALRRIGAEALISQTPQRLPGPTAIARADFKEELKNRRPLNIPPDMLDPTGLSTGWGPPRDTMAFSKPLLVAENPAAVSRLIENPVYGKDIEYVARDGPQKQQRWKRANMRSEIDEIVYGRDMDFSTGDAKLESGNRDFVEEDPNVDHMRLLRNQAKHFLARVHGRGPHGFPEVAAFFRAAAVDGVIGQETFGKVCMAEGLVRTFFESRNVFRLYSRLAPGPDASGDVLEEEDRTMDIEGFLIELRGKLSPERLSVVQEVWRRLDPECQGEIESGHLFANYDERRLPSVKYGVVECVEARRELVEAFGASGQEYFPSVDLDKADFSMTEALQGRRNKPIGLLGSNIHAPAGKPRCPLIKRRHADIVHERAEQAPAIDLHKPITADDFEAYYALISGATFDDELFFRIARDPWTGLQAHNEATALRVHLERSKFTDSKPASCFRVVAIFKDGSQRPVILRDDEGIQEAAYGGGGVHCNQFWSWGAGAKKEVIKRLEQQGISGIQTVRLAPS
mmetsp:Transcript_66842/g.116224  ORF Transcript_66842/g.116224 Transcript_66842/m.116224 type:complete len:581 (-) Transcript_66842:96-1838(-)